MPPGYREELAKLSMTTASNRSPRFPARPGPSSRHTTPSITLAAPRSLDVQGIQGCRPKSRGRAAAGQRTGRRDRRSETARPVRREQRPAQEHRRPRRRARNRNHVVRVGGELYSRCDGGTRDLRRDLRRDARPQHHAGDAGSRRNCPGGGPERAAHPLLARRPFAEGSGRAGCGAAHEFPCPTQRHSSGWPELQSRTRQEPDGIRGSRGSPCRSTT